MLCSHWWIVCNCYSFVKSTLRCSPGCLAASHGSKETTEKLKQTFPALKLWTRYQQGPCCWWRGEGHDWGPNTEQDVHVFTGGPGLPAKARLVNSNQESRFRRALQGSYLRRLQGKGSLWGKLHWAFHLSFRACARTGGSCQGKVPAGHLATQTGCPME